MESTEKQSQASFEVDIRNGIIKVSGPVGFVEEQIRSIKADINIIQAISDYKPAVELAVSSQIITEKSSTIASLTSKYDNVISIDSTTGKVHILNSFISLPKATATFEIALIYVWAKKQIGIDLVPFKEIREACQDHGVLDQANFASHIDKHKQYFIIDKSTSNYTMRLTNPGIKLAEQILEKYNKI